jgi:hypothetical protein
MRAKELLQLIPEEIFQSLAIETKVDHQVKKLNGYFNVSIDSLFDDESEKN